MGSPTNHRRARWAAAGFVALMAFGLAGGPTIAATPKAPSPQAVVETYYGTLNTVLQRAEALGFAGRYKTLNVAIKQTFDVGFVSRFAVGRFWNKFDDKQKAALKVRMGRLMAATYAARFKSYAGEKFEVLKTAPTSRGDQLVQTRIVKSDGKPVAIDYRLRLSAIKKNPKAAKEWRIIDVYLRGRISELAKWRAEFSSILQRQGYDGLIAAIDKKVAQLGAG